MNRRVIDLWYDVNNRYLVSDEGTNTQQATDPYVFFKENVLFRIRLVEYDPSTSAFVAYTDLASDDAFSISIDDDFDYTSELWVKENNTAFNVAGDWESGGTADPTAGEISVRVDMDTVSTEAALSTSPNISGNCEILIRSAGSIDITGVIRFPIDVINIQDSINWVELTAGTDYNPTAVDASTVTMMTDQTENIIEDAAIRVYWSDTYHYGIASSITASSLTLSGLSLPSGASALDEMYYEILPSTVRAQYATLDETLALLNGKQDTDNTAASGDIAIFGSTGSTITSNVQIASAVGASLPHTKVLTEGAVINYLAATAYTQAQVASLLSLKMDKDADAVSNNILVYSTGGNAVDSNKSFASGITESPAHTKVPTQKAVYDFITACWGTLPASFSALDASYLQIPSGLSYGDVLYIGSGGIISRLPAGTSGETLHTAGSGNIPYWNKPFNRQDILYDIAGTVTGYDLYYFNGSGWTQADADDDTKGADKLLAVALGTNAANDGMLLKGFVTNGAWSFTPGAVLYMSTTAGDITETAPSANANIVRIVGYAISATQIYFNPSSEWIELDVI